MLEAAEPMMRASRLLEPAATRDERRSMEESTVGRTVSSRARRSTEPTSTSVSLRWAGQKGPADVKRRDRDDNKGGNE